MFIDSRIESEYNKEDTNNGRPARPESGFVQESTGSRGALNGGNE